MGNVNKLKLYKYMDQTLKKIQSLKNQTSLESIILDHKEKKLDEHLKDRKTIEIIDID